MSCHLELITDSQIGCCCTPSSFFFFLQFLCSFQLVRRHSILKSPTSVDFFQVIRVMAGLYLFRFYYFLSFLLSIHFTSPSFCFGWPFKMTKIVDHSRSFFVRVRLPFLLILLLPSVSLISFSFIVFLFITTIILFYYLTFGIVSLLPPVLVHLFSFK